MLIKLTKIIFLQLSFLSLFVYGQAESCEKTFTLGLGNIWPPYYFEEQGQAKGIDIEIAESIFSQSNYCLRYIKMPSSSRALAELEKGNIDFLYGASFSQERAEYAIFSTAYRYETIRTFWNKDKLPENRISSLTGLFTEKLRAATNRGSYIGGQGKALTQKENQAYISHVPTIERRMKMLAFKRVDFTIEDEIAGLFYLQKNKIKNMKMLPFIVYQNEISLVFSKKTISAQQVEKINHIIINNKEKFKTIIKRYQ